MIYDTNCLKYAFELGGRVVREVDYKSQGPGFEPESTYERSNRRIGFQKSKANLHYIRGITLKSITNGEACNRVLEPEQ